MQEVNSCMEDMLFQGAFSRRRKRIALVLAFALLFSLLPAALPGGAAQAATPGASSAEPVLWLKADDGLTFADGAISGWTNVSSIDEPVQFEYVPSTNPIHEISYKPTGVNFNPAVNFSNSTSGSHYSSSTSTKF